MTDKELIEQILSKLTSLILRYDSDGVFLRRVSIETTAEELAQLCIKSDGAREYWTNPIQRDYEWESYIAKVRERFIEQACEAVDEFILNLETIQYDAGGITEEQEQLLHMAQQAIREKFNE